MKRIVEQIRISDMSDVRADMVRDDFLRMTTAMKDLVSSHTPLTNALADIHALAVYAYSNPDPTAGMYSLADVSKVRALTARLDEKEHRFHKAVTQFELGKDAMGRAVTIVLQGRKDEVAAAQLGVVAKFYETAQRVSELGRGDLERHTKMELPTRLAICDVATQMAQVRNTASQNLLTEKTDEVKQVEDWLVGECLTVTSNSSQKFASFLTPALQKINKFMGLVLPLDESSVPVDTPVTMQLFDSSYSCLDMKIARLSYI